MKKHSRCISILISFFMLLNMLTGIISTPVYAAEGEDYVFTITDSGGTRIDNNSSNTAATKATAIVNPGDEVYFVVNAPGNVHTITSLQLSMTRMGDSKQWAGNHETIPVTNMMWTVQQPFQDNSADYYPWLLLTRLGEAGIVSPTGDPVPLAKWKVTVPANAASGTTFKMILGKGTTLAKNGVNVFGVNNSPYKNNDVVVFEITVQAADQFNDPVYTWAPDNSSVTATKECTTDPTKTVTEIVNTTSTVTQQPTCTAKGKTKYTATFTKPEFTTQTKTVSNINALGHDLQKTNAVAATCTVAGNSEYWTCQRSNCGKMFSDANGNTEITAVPTIPATGHAYGSWTSISATQHKHVCGNDSSHEEVENHTWNSGVVTTAATEEAPGVKTYTCTKCGETKTEEIPQLAHTHNMTEIPAKAATCTEAGNNKYYKCTKCNKYYKDANGKDETTVATETIAALGHSWGAWTKKDDDQHERVCSHDASHKETGSHSWNQGVVTKPATEDETGIRTYTCSVCNGTKTEEIPQLNHTHAMQEIPAKAATCTEAGNNKYYKCTKCNKYYKDANGKDETTVATETIAALGHSWGAWTKKDDDQHERVCSHDASHKETESHSWNQGEVTKPATEDETGIRTYTCSICNGTKTETIPKIVVKYTVIFKDGSKELKRVPNLTNGAAVDDYTPKKRDYVFDKWTPDFKPTVDPADFDSNRELIYTAEWKEDKNNNGTPDEEESSTARYTVTYTDGVGGSVFADKVFNDVIDGAYVPSFGNNPKRSGYIFVDWDKAVPEKVTSDLTFNATWVEENGDQLLVTFETDSQGTISGKAYALVRKDEFVANPPDAVPVDGKIWVGWESSEGGVYDNVALKKLPITGHTTFTAKYADSGKAVAIFNYAGGKDVSGKSSTTIIGNPGASYTVPDYTKITREGYTATGWTPSGAGTFGEANKSVTYTLGWKIVETQTPEVPKPNKDDDTSSKWTGKTEADVEKLITTKNTEEPAGATFGMLRAKGVSKNKSSINLSWTKVPGTAKYVVYANRCGAKNRYKKHATLKASKKSLKVTKVLKKKLKPGTYYKFMVVAFDKNNNVLAVSKTIHVTTTGGKYGNDKSVKLKNPTKSKLSLKVKKTHTIKAVEVQSAKKTHRHRKLAYESTNKKVAKVSKKGKITAVGPGKCTIYVYAQNGVYKKITVTVKK